VRFSEWLITEQTISIPISRLFGWKPKVEEAINDLHNGLLSHSAGKPIIVSRLDNPRGAFFMMDGYHRVFEAMMAGQTAIDGQIDIYTPRIERSGGAHNEMVGDKVRLIDVLNRLPQ